MPDTHKGKKFICDYYTAGMTVIRIIRSSVRSGIIKSVTIPEMPEGYGIIDHSGIPGDADLHVFNRSMPVLCNGRVNYLGEAVLLLYGPDERDLDDFASEIVIEYEETEQHLEFDDFDQQQVDRECLYTKGKPAKNFSKAAKVVEETYRTAPQHHYDLEPQGATAVRIGDSIELISATQWPFNVRDNVASVIGIKPAEVTIKVPSMGKTHSGKLWYAGLLASYSALVTWKTGSPSICLLTKKDSILYTPGRAETVITHKTGMDESGQIICRSIDISLNTGAYPMLSDEVVNRLCFSASGVYKVPALEVKARTVITNRSPAGAFNGMGFHQGFLAAEIHNNRLAAESNLDTLEWRVKNIAQSYSQLPIGWENRKNLHLKNLLEMVASASDFSRKQASYTLVNRDLNKFSGNRRGIGISLCCQGNGFMGRIEENEKYTVSVRLDKEGKLSIMTSAVPENFQTTALWKKIAGDILELETDDVLIESTSTSLVPDSGPSLFSRNITVITSLIEKCCNAIKKSRFRLPLPIEVKRSYRLSGSSSWDPETFTGTPFSTVSWGAAVVETATDPISMDTTVRGVWLAVDCGKVVDETLARAELETEIYRSIMRTLFPISEIRHHDSSIPAAPPQPLNHIPIRIEFLKSRDPKPGGIGDLPDCLIPAAVTSAINMGLGIQTSDLPSSPEQLFHFFDSKTIPAEIKNDD